MRIGRAPKNELVLADERVSRTHAQVRPDGGQYIVEDLGSSNGVHVSGHRVERAPLANGRRIEIGGSVLVFVEPVPEIPQADRLRLLDSSELLRALRPDTKATLAAGLAARFYPEHSVLVRQGEPLEQVILVHRGHVRVVWTNDERAEEPNVEISVAELPDGGAGRAIFGVETREGAAPARVEACACGAGRPCGRPPCPIAGVTLTGLGEHMATPCQSVL